MLKWIFRLLIVLVVAFGAAFYWLIMSDASAPKTAPDIYPIADWRAAVAETAIETRPTGIAMLELSSNNFPSFAVQAGRFGDDVAMAMTSFRIETPQGSIVVGGAVDEVTAANMAETAEAPSNFDPLAYKVLTDAMLSANQIIMTHEHLDHVMAIARHPEPARIASQLWLNAPQKAALGGFALNGKLPTEFEVIPPRLNGDTQMIAPGVVIVPNPGHTPGSQLVFISLQDGREYLLIGDTVWAMSNIAALKTRPVLTQYIVFEPNEDRTAVKQQIRALHDLQAAEPDLKLVPSHDQDYLSGLIEAGDLKRGF